MLNFVQTQIDKRNSLLRDSDQLLKEYNEENEIISGYNGRQILELLQNCDDQGSTEVLIKLEQESNTITICNTGVPFSERGYKSLFMPFRSSKISKKDYIGNKGLGFRSIINWSERVEIISNGMSLAYSQENRKKFFYANFDQQTRKELLDEEGLSENAIPVPFLGIPEIKTAASDPNYVTIIAIKYHARFLKNILFQIKQITPETLFFLKSLQVIKFEGFDNQIKSIITHKTAIDSDASQFGPVEKITYNQKTWYIFKEEESLGTVIQNDKKEQEFYQIKIAMEENMEYTNSRLYSFFPTNIYLHQPYILHATFDLDATRNQLVESDKNKIILQKAVQFTIRVAKYFTNGGASYKPLQILTHKHKADTLNNLGYYDWIQAAFKKEALFPCVDNRFRKLKEVVYYGDGFANMLLDSKATEILGFHLLPAENLNLQNIPFFDEVYKSFENIKDVIGVFNRISDLPLTMEQRAAYIFEITKKGGELKKKYTNRLNLLLDKDGNKILGTEYIYTPETKDSALQTPSYSRIKFINRSLYLLLSSILGFNADRDRNRSRFISDKLQGLCNIHSFEPANLARKIINETNAEIKKSEDGQIGIIQQMNSCLFHNFQFINTENINTALPFEIPAITLDGGISLTSNTVLCSIYPRGKINQTIFEDIYTDADFIAAPKQLGIEIPEGEESILKVQEYLKWLKVNDHSRYAVKDFDNSGALDYFQSIHKEAYTRYKLSVTTIHNFENILKQLSFEKFILWIHTDPVLKTQLYQDKNTDKVEYLYRNNYVYNIKKSYLKYLIGKHYQVKFHNLLIDDKYSWVNDFEIDYRHALFMGQNISKTVIQEILVALGAKDEFNNLPIDKVAEIINMLCIKYPDGTKSSGFYKKALSHFRENKIVIKTPLQLFADDGESLKIYNQEQVYFSEKIKIPNRLKKDFPVFNFPPRSGGVEAIKFFAINDLNDLKLELESYQIHDALSVALNSHLKELKPYILAQRIHDFDELKSQQTQASICSKIKIYVCEKLEYTVNGKHYSTLDFEFLHHSEQTYYIKVNYIKEFSHLLKKPAFTDSIAEIIALSFDVKNDKAEFRNLIRNDIEIAKNDIIRDYGKDVLKEAKELLGLADYKEAFWKTIFDLKGIEYEMAMDDLSLNQRITDKLNLNFEAGQLDYESISSISQINKIKDLFTDLKIQLSDFVQFYPYELSYEPYHFKNLRDLILSKKIEAKYAIWKKLNILDTEAKKNFVDTINKFENFEEFVNSISEEKKYEFSVNYPYYLDLYIKQIYGNIELNESINFQEMLLSNRLHFTAQQILQINQNAGLKSLLYFDNSLDELKAILQEQNKINETPLQNIFGTPASSNDVGSKSPTNVPAMVSSEKLKYKPATSNATSKRKPYFNSGENNDKLKQIGNSSEDIVIKYLEENNYSNIYKVTEDNEGLHYDIRFTDNDGNIKFIEVKTFNNGMFYLSKDEYDFGSLNQHDYEIWLVNNGSIIFPIKDFFTNPKYHLIPNQYTVYLDIEK